MQRLLKMLLGCRALVGRIFCNREINQENRIGRRELLGATEITERAGEIMWTYTSPELYQLLVLRRGWTPTELGDFVATAMMAVLLPE